MAAPRRVIELAFTREDVAELRRLARSRTEPASRVERARMLLAYRETPSFYAVGRALGVTHQTAERCLRRPKGSASWRLSTTVRVRDASGPSLKMREFLLSILLAANPKISDMRT